MISAQEVLSFLQDEVPDLASVPPEAIARLAQACAPRALSPGELLVREGEPSESLFIVHSGQMEARCAGAPGPLGWFSRGDLVGEMSLLTAQPRSATLTTRRHVLALELPYAVCREVILSSPGALAVLSQRMLERARGALRSARRGPGLVAVVRAGALSVAMHAAVWLREAIQDHGGVGYVDMGRAPPPTDLGALARWLHDAEGEQGLCVLDALTAPPALVEVALARADRVLAFVDDLNGPEVRPLVERLGTDTLDLVLINRPEVVVEHTPTLDTHLVRSPAGLTHLITLLADELGDARSLPLPPEWASLPDEVLAEVHASMRRRAVPGGSPLVRIGDVSDTLYLILAGRFRVQGADGEVYCELESGEAFGELGVITHQPRSANVIALRDSVVGVLSADTLRSQALRHPSLALLMARTAARLASGGPVFDRRPPRNLAVLPLSRSARARGLAEALARAFSGLGLQTCTMDAAAVERTWGPGGSTLSRFQAGERSLVSYLHHVEQDHEVVLYCCGAPDAPWTERCLRQADRVLLVADHDDAPALHAVERRLAESPEFTAPVHLALLQPAGVTEASGTARWLEPRPGVLHHHVRPDTPADLGRLARRLTDRAIGLALAGASSRGYAHNGVIRGLLSLGIPIDVIAGSSSGAAAAAVYTMGQSWAASMESSLRATEDAGLTVGRLQPPLTSIMSGEDMNESCQGLFGDQQIEDMIIPGVFTAVDLNRHELVHLRRGPLWKAVRASTSLPMFWPPVWWGDRLLVDGGLISYVPVESVLDECRVGLPIASDLDPESGGDRLPFEGFRDYGAGISGWRLLAEQLGLAKKGPPAPSIVDVLFHTMCMKSFEQAEAAHRDPRFRSVRFVRPRIRADGFFTVDRARALEYEREAYRATREALADVRPLALPEERVEAPEPLER
ncbi:MAG: cyclic nucleotide-binding domain-containing protein [Alphaproteobacteria bacterium]|nr:cyclic nucleotide-binding domain-containing protein [Alphaproteobacteria bacterium]MCB9795862.1 cyclic nucleotide-binding domain-containing protein [Alphaproteobacteria bacterium]